MTISSESLDWLHSVGVTSANTGDLDDAYSFEHELSGRPPLVTDRVHVAPDGTKTLIWRVMFRTAEDLPVLEVPMSRRLFAEWPLSGGHETGLVVRLGSFRVRSEYRRRQLARAVRPAEESLLRRWGVRELQMLATDDGPAVWIKKFGFLPAQPEILKIAYKEWAARPGASPDTDFPLTPADYPWKFLLSRGALDLYKVLS
jgi:hypothetical protein